MNGRIRAIARKEFRHILRDPGSLGALLGLPLFLLLMFGYAVSLDVDEVPLAIRDLDRTPESRALAEAFFAGGRFVGVDPGPGTGESVLESGRAAAVLEIPPGFARALGRGESAPVRVAVDGSDGTRAQTVAGYIDGLCLRYGGDLRALEAERAGPADGGPPPAVLDIRPRVLFNQELRSVVFLVPGLVALILVITAVVSTALAVVREKENGSMEQILVSPVGALELILGKTLPYAAVGAVSASIVLGTAAFLFGVEVAGSVAALAWTTGLFLLASLALGVLISTMADTQQVAFLISTMLTLIPTFTLSGFVFPVRNMPAVIRWVTRLFPTTYYLEILKAIVIKGAPFRYYAGPAAALALYAAAAIAAASVRFSRERSRSR